MGSENRKFILIDDENHQLKEISRKRNDSKTNNKR